MTMDAVKAAVSQENKQIKMAIMTFPLRPKSLSLLPNGFGWSADLLLAVKNVKRVELVGLLQ